jgi:hypothetical protein
MTNITYPFSNKSSSHLTYDIDNIYDNLHTNDEIDGDGFMVEYLVYYINTSAYKPFLEFMLYKSDNNNMIYLPNFSQNTSNYDILENSTMLLDNLFGNDMCEFKGRLIESPVMNTVKNSHINKRIILLYKLKEKNNTVLRCTGSSALWWATVSEIFNYRKILFYDIHETVTDIFLAYPQALKLYHKESLVETPMVVFNGNNSNTAKYNAVFSIKKSNSDSRYGPYYYFTDLYSSMRYACYDIETGEKNNKGGLVRFVIFTGKMKMFLKKNKPDRSDMAKYICLQHPIEKNTIQFRDNDCKWTEQYNSAYNGNYEIDIKKSNDVSLDNKYEIVDTESKNNYDSESDYDSDSESISEYVSDIKLSEGENKNRNIRYLAMRICISEYNFQTPLSYYYINTKDIPNKYEYEFKKYKII